MKNVLIRIFRSVLPTSAPGSRILDLRSLARRYGRGNVRIQLGRIMGSSSYASMRKRVLAYDF